MDTATQQKRALKLIGNFFCMFENQKNRTGISAYERIAYTVMQESLTEAYISLDKAFENNTDLLPADGILPAVHLAPIDPLHLVTICRHQLHELFFQSKPIGDNDKIHIYDHGDTITAYVEKADGQSIQIHHSESISF